MRKASLAACVAALVLGLGTAPGAEAFEFGIGVRAGDVGATFSYSDYPEYSGWWNGSGSPASLEVMLGGYGDWQVVAGLGRVWRPWVQEGWRPFTYGRWVWTDMGWTWVSYEPWGFVPFHYGNWALAPAGWVWVPGYSYSPGNVVWFSAGAYVGWYPRGPRGWDEVHRAYQHGYDRGWHDGGHANWVRWNDLDREDLSRRLHRGTFDATAARTLPSFGRRDFERHTGRGTTAVPVATRELRIGDRSVRVVRPEGVIGSIRAYGRDARRGGEGAVAGRQEDRRGLAGRDGAVPWRGRDPYERSRSVSREERTRPGNPESWATQRENEIRRRAEAQQAERRARERVEGAGERAWSKQRASEIARRSRGQEAERRARDRQPDRTRDQRASGNSGQGRTAPSRVHQRRERPRH